MYNVVIFLVGGSLQTAATTPSKLYLALMLLSFSEYSLLVDLVAGRAIAGLAVGALTHVVPVYYLQCQYLDSVDLWLHYSNWLSHLEHRQNYLQDGQWLGMVMLIFSCLQLGIRIKRRTISTVYRTPRRLKMAPCHGYVDAALDIILLPRKPGTS